MFPSSITLRDFYVNRVLPLKVQGEGEMISLRMTLGSTTILNQIRFDPSLLFTGGEQGVLIDPSDLSTLFTDTAGTTPVTAPGQTVARVNDKSGRGNHLTQSVAAARPIYGRHPAGGIRNRLTATELFNNPAWAGSVTVTPEAGVAPDGASTADLLTTQTVSSPNIRQSITLAAGQYTASLYLKAGTSASVSLGMFVGSFIAATPVIISGPGTVSGTSLCAVSGLSTSEWTRVAFTFTTGAASPALYIYPEGPSVGTGKNVLAWGAQLELGSTATAYQRVGAPSGLTFPQPQSYDITEAGVPSLHYLFCDGLARWMVSPTITPGVDKAQIFTGVRKLSDTSTAAIVESSTTSTNTGAFGASDPASAAPPLRTFGFRSQSAFVPTSTEFLSPSSAVNVAISDRSAPSITLRRNGGAAGSSGQSHGSGNYLAYPLYVGSRAGTLAFFNGLIYSLVVRFGPNLPLATIQQVERWTAQRTGVTL